MRTTLHRKATLGFTLMELVVVVALIAVILGLSFPRIRLALDADQERRELDAFVAILEGAGREAVEKKEEVLLTMHEDHRSMLLSDGREWKFPDSIRIHGLRRAGKDLPETLEILFYPRGYADPVFFWLEGAMGRKTFVLHPLQVRAEILSEFVVPEGWDHGA